MRAGCKLNGRHVPDTCEVLGSVSCTQQERRGNSDSAEMGQQCYGYHSSFSVILGQAEDQSPESGESLGRKVGVSMVTADLGLVSMIRQGILALQLLPSNSSAGQ